MDKALIIDDSRAMRRILGAAIRELGYDVSEAGNGREALATLEGLDAPPALILVDWNMPEMNGLEFVVSLRSDSRHDRSKVIMVTTETAMDQMVKALDAGADEYVMKPFTKDILLDKLRLLGILN